ncbi:MAG: tetratricopeptide repeat protein [Myxococcales bacterium]|nr:tetratricopeptide repeat protein [Myxococcales bacterium]
MRRFFFSTLVALGLLIGAPLHSPSPATAQDDWGVRRDPFDKGLIKRYKSLLSRRPGDAKALGKLMAMYRRYRSIGLLVREYEGAQQKRPSFSNLMVLGYLQRHEGAPDKALARFTEAVTLDPKSPLVHNELGKMLRAKGQRAEAISHYEKALALATGKKQKMRVLRALAELAMESGDIEAAKAHLETFLKLDPKNSQTMIELGEALAQHKRYDEAIAIFRETEANLRSDPMTRVEMVTRIGLALEGKGESLAAVQEYERGIKIGGRGYYTTKELTARIVAIYRQRQELDTLISKLETQWKSKKRSYFEWDTLAKLYEETGIADKAIAAYRKATKSAPYELDTQRRLIVLLENSGREAEALKQYENVIRVAPGEPRFQLELAKRYWKLGQIKQAMAMAKKIRARFSSDPGVVSSLADLYTGWEQPKESLDAYETLTRIDPGDPRHLENLGERHFQDGNRSKAEKVWLRIIRLKSADNFARLASIYAEHDMLSESVTMYGEAIALQGKNSKHYKGRANVYERLRRIDDSVKDWEMVLKLSPDKKSYASVRQEARRHVVNLLARTSPGRHRRKSPLEARILAWNVGFSSTPRRIGDGFYLVEAYRRLNEGKKMQGVLEELLTLRATDQSVMLQLVKSYRVLRQHDEAIAMLLALAKLNPGRERDYYNQIAEIKTDLQLDDEAIEYVRRALEKSPNDPIAYQRLAERYQAMQKQDKAIESYEKVLELSPRSFAVSFVLARLYINGGQREKATALYRNVLANASSPEVLHKAGREAVELEWLNGSLSGLLDTVSPLVAAYGHKPMYRRILVQIYDRYVPSLAADLEDGDAKTRLAARAKLDKLGSTGLRPLLEALADDDDQQQQQAAVAVLGYLGNPAAAAPLVRLAKRAIPKSHGHTSSLLPSLSWDVKVQALIAAARLGDSRTIPTLVELAKHKENSMREAAVFALGVTGDAKALSALLAASEDETHKVQTMACLAFSEFRDAKSIRMSTQRAVQILSDEGAHDLTRAACAWVLGHRRNRDGQEQLLRALARGNDQTQRLSAWALGELGAPNAIPDLIAAFASKREPVRSTAAQALTKLLSKDAALQTPGTIARHAIYPVASRRFDSDRAIRALGTHENSGGFDPALLIGQQKHLAFGLRRAIARHRDLVLRALTDLDQDEDGISFGPLSAEHGKLSAAKQAAVQETLRALGRNLFPEMTSLAQHRDPEVRARSLSIISKIGGDSARELLRSGLADTDRQVRRKALHAAARLANESPKQTGLLATTVQSRLSAPHWQERVAAANALAQWPKSKHTNSHLDALMQALHSDDKGFVRAAAATALGRLLAGTSNAEADAVAVLSRASDSAQEPLSTVRFDAVRALQSIGGSVAKQHLAAVAKSDPSKRVRDAASQI